MEVQWLHLSLSFWGRSMYFHADVQIPDGAEIDYLRVFYYDDSILKGLRASSYLYFL